MIVQHFNYSPIIRTTKPLSKTFEWFLPTLLKPNYFVKLTITISFFNCLHLCPFRPMCGLSCSTNYYSTTPKRCTCLHFTCPNHLNQPSLILLMKSTSNFLHMHSFLISLHVTAHTSPHSHISRKLFDMFILWNTHGHFKLSLVTYRHLRNTCPTNWTLPCRL